MIEAYKTQLKIQLDSMDELMEIQEGLDSRDPTGEAELQCMQNILVRQAQSSDELFFQTGVDEDFLSYCIRETKFSSEPEFAQLLAESQAELAEKMKERGEM